MYIPENNIIISTTMNHCIQNSLYGYYTVDLILLFLLFSLLALGITSSVITFAPLLQISSLHTLHYDEYYLDKLQLSLKSRDSPYLGD